MDPLLILAGTVTPLIIYAWYRIIRSYSACVSQLQAEERLAHWARRYDDESGVRHSSNPPPPKREAA